MAEELVGVRRSCFYSLCAHCVGSADLRVVRLLNGPQYAFGVTCMLALFWLVHVGFGHVCAALCIYVCLHLASGARRQAVHPPTSPALLGVFSSTFFFCMKGQLLCLLWTDAWRVQCSMFCALLFLHVLCTASEQRAQFSPAQAGGGPQSHCTSPLLLVWAGCMLFVGSTSLPCVVSWGCCF